MGAVGAMSPWYYSQLESLARAFEFSLDVPVKDMEKQDLDRVLYGTKRKRIDVQHHTRRGKTYRWRTAFEGVINNLERRYKDTESDHVRSEIERYMSTNPCSACKGEKLRPEARAVTVCGINIMDVTNKSIAQASDWIAAIGGDSGQVPHSLDKLETGSVPLSSGVAANGAAANGTVKGAKGRKRKSKASRNGRVKVEHPSVLSDREKAIAGQILKEIEARLTFLLNVGLDYLTLSRTASTLSGGEAQRIRLATQIGSGLMGVLYVCDEPSIGLHPADDYRLIQTLKGLRDLGNTVLIVEHDEAIMRAADYIVDLGPGAGEHGGHIVATGPVEDIMASAESITGQYLSGRRQIPLPAERRPGNGEHLVIRGAAQNNLKDIDVEIPLGMLVCVTGVSGSGKSTLINEILYKKLAQQFYRARDRAGAVRDIEGVEHIDKVVDIDQSPIGRTPRSNPATYTDTFTPIRELFSTVPEARMRGYKPGRFSFNVKGGRCEACTGDGHINIEMQFLPDVTVPCEICEGKRYNREALEIYWRDANIADVLAMTVTEALEAFENIPRVRTAIADFAGCGAGVHTAGAACDAVERGRGAAGEIGEGAVEAGDGEDAVHSGRADDGAVVRGLRAFAAGAAAAGGRGEYGGAYRASPGHDKERGLADRPGSGRG